MFLNRQHLIGGRGRRGDGQHRYAAHIALPHQLENEVALQIQVVFVIAQDHLPVLQHALMRTWDCWAENHQAGEPMDLRHYEMTGEMAEALTRHADEIYASLPDDACRRSAQKLFQALTEKGADNRGLRRPLPLEHLIEIVGSETETREVIEAFRAAGRTFLLPGEGKPLEPDTVVDISQACQGPERRRLLDLGVVPGTVVTAEMQAFSGDPTAYRIRGAMIALRQEQADSIQVERKPLLSEMDHHVEEVLS